MGKTAFLFPGQGAQYVGMGKDFYETYDVARRVFEIAKEATGLDVAELCFTENDKLNITEYTQIAMLTTEVATLKVLESMGYHADITAGLSLGEYGALAACGAMELKDLFHVIRKRGIFMQEAYPVGGAMAAVLGLDAEKIAAVCEETEGIVSIANDNCPGQIVITGEETAVSRACEKLVEAGARKCIPLKVSGPFHSVLLTDAGRQLGEVLENVEIRDLKIPYICNVNASVVEDKSCVKELLTRQVSSGVRFRESILKMKEMGVTTFIEIGPGKTLSGFIKKIDKELTTINIDKVTDLEKLAQVTGGVDSE